MAKNHTIGAVTGRPPVGCALPASQRLHTATPTLAVVAHGVLPSMGVPAWTPMGTAWHVVIGTESGTRWKEDSAAGHIPRPG